MNGRPSRRSICTRRAKGFWGLLWRGRKRPPARTTTGWILPNIVKLHVKLPMGELVSYASNIPIDETTTLTKFMSLRSFFTGRWADNNALKRSLKIYYQDQAIMEKVRPRAPALDLSSELNVRCDLLASPIAAAARNSPRRAGSCPTPTPSPATCRGAPPPSSRRLPAARTPSRPRLGTQGARVYSLRGGPAAEEAGCGEDRRARQAARGAEQAEPAPQSR